MFGLDFFVYWNGWSGRHSNIISVAGESFWIYNQSSLPFQSKHYACANPNHAAQLHCIVDSYTRRGGRLHASTHSPNSVESLLRKNPFEAATGMRNNIMIPRSDLKAKPRSPKYSPMIPIRPASKGGRIRLIPINFQM